MASHAGCTVSPALHIARVPGELGSVVRCSGDLTVATGEALRRELDLLTSLRQPALVLNVSGCRSVDAEGVLLLLETHQRLREAGRRFAVVVGTEAAARVIRTFGIDRLLPVFPTEASAAHTLRDGNPFGEASVARSEARAETLEMWRELLGSAGREDGRRGCATDRRQPPPVRWAAEILQARGVRDCTRCILCPLLHALGTQTDEWGCQSVTRGMLDSLLTGNRGMARANVARLIELIEAINLLRQ